IGYSACHWCHVMEHESFEDEATARIQNEHFINIKVDMEERPDVDQIYMSFVQITTGRGGWPMNVFITPEKLPFFGGTYFPPSQRYGMPSWQQILMSIAEAWKERRDELMKSAVDILGELRRMSVTEMASGGVDESLLDTAFQSFVRSFDAKEGGWGGAPKFPQAMSLEFLLRYWKRTGDSGALEMVRKTAEKMANGGIYDQIGGGFHRYAVDAIWLVPHFEKMLYDNAQLIRVYLHLYQILRSGRSSTTPSAQSGGHPSSNQEGSLEGEFFKRIAVETLEYVKREMLDASGGFYSSQDADSEGEEGKFFVWTPEEVETVLGDADGREFCTFYDVTADGNFEGKNILNIKDARVENPVAIAPGSDTRKKLFDVREKRIKPFRDEKVLTAWNGLMLAAFAEAAAVLDSVEYLEIAKKNADFLSENLRKPDRKEGPNYQGESYAVTDAQVSATGAESTTPSAEAGSKPPKAGGEFGNPVAIAPGSDMRLLRTWKDGRAKLNGYLEDYANLADGLIELYQVSGEIRYLTAAKELADAMITEFWDAENGGFFFTSNDHEELIVRNKDFFDNATPSGNSVAADVLLKLAKFYGEEKYERFATTALRIATNQITRYPQGFGRTLATIEFYVSQVMEVVILGEPGNELERELWSDYQPAKVVATSSAPVDGALPLLNGRTTLEGKPTAYVCENFVCQRPVTNAEELRQMINSGN
ncbi:MAG: thioredoxin domain-containing protein, partial [Acidobacteria bacterium]|nr:thioredoxin domain-containing protein [Acidobacteriota bacterium]